MLTDTILDAARRRGDPLADGTVAEIFKAGDTAAVAHLVAALMRDDQPFDGLPAPVRDYFAKTGAIIPRPPATVLAGERVFAEHGPEILMLLCCYSLPSSYAARNGVQVLHRTAYLAKRPNRRLFETAQMIVDVMSPGGLGPRGRGLRSAQKVRLMHAAIRHLILAGQEPWPLGEFGVPINQEDMLGTLMTFSWITLDGLNRLGVRITPQEQEAYLSAWIAVGTLMGIEPGLLPASVAEARDLTALIERRQVRESAEGREMIAALLGMMEANMPHPFKTVPASLIREFLPPDVAGFLGIPSHPLEEELIRLANKALRPLERFVDMEAKRHAFVRTVSVHLLRWMIRIDLDGQPARFALPDSLSEGWMVAPPDSEESFWQKLHERFHRH